MSFPLPPILNYYLKARTSLYIHSPFVFNFCQNVLYAPKKYYAFEQIAGYRKELYQNKEIIGGNDAGQGSNKKQKNRTVAQYARIASMPDKFGTVLFKSVLHFDALQILELGTCLGIGTAYMAMANNAAKVVTIEGNTALANKATDGLRKMNLTNVTVLNKLFDNALPELGLYMPYVDMAFIDGNHNFSATVRYFESILPFSHPKTIFIFDDIHWSSDMLKAWRYLVNHKHTSIAINLGRMGFISIDPALPKQEFVLLF